MKKIQLINGMNVTKVCDGEITTGYEHVKEINEAFELSYEAFHKIAEIRLKIGELFVESAFSNEKERDFIWISSSDYLIVN